MGGRPVGGYEILEHTADVGVRARGSTLEEVFEEATKGLADISGVWLPGNGASHDIAIEPGDHGAMLVDWLSEVVYLQDARRATISGVRVDSVDASTGVRGTLELEVIGEDTPEGTQIKAVTYHQLRVEPTGDGWEAQVYFDV